jgi:hypothetical protein
VRYLKQDECLMVTSGLRRNLVIVLAIKAAVILLAALFVFGPSQRPRIDPGTLDRRILGNPDSINQESSQ